MTPATITPSAPPVGAEPSERLLTAADLAALPDELPTGPVYYELNNGRLVIMPAPGDIHGAVEAQFATLLVCEGQRRGLGKARSGEVSIVLWRNPDRVVAADAAFITNASLPIKHSPEGYLETIPELIVEVMSKNDSIPAVERKLADYFRAGVKVAVVANPAKKTISVYRPGQTQQVLTEKDVLTVEDVIPGFKMPVAEAFE